MSLNRPMRDWAGQRVWIIGASSGIGHATASALHAQGAAITVSARNRAALDEFVASHPGATALGLDVTDEASLEAAVQSVVQAGPLHLLMYCAGHFEPMSALALEANEVARHWQVNYMGAIRVLARVLPALRAQSAAGQASHISLVGSVAGYLGLPQSLAYGPTKAAIINLAETLYADLKGAGIDVSLVNPGFVASPLTAKNMFRMPALITPQTAATEILRGWGRGQFEIHFPKRFTLWTKLLGHLPYTAAFAVTRRLVPTPRATQSRQIDTDR
ncbi:MAG: SDR family NAD(P)-dependent oxidoreductase [Rhodoferax sp.]